MAVSFSGNTPRAPSAYPQRTGEEHLRRLNAYEAQPEIDAVIRKLIPDVEVAGGHTTHAPGYGQIQTPDPAYLRTISSTVAQNTTDATSLEQLLPDMELLKNLLISSIMAPKDLVTSKVNFTVDRRGFSLPISARLLEIIVDHFTNVYNIKGLSPEILADVLFQTGSYALMVIPENSVDGLINGTTGYSQESFRQVSGQIFHQKEYRSMGMLGPGVPAANAKVAPSSTVRMLSAMESFSDIGAVVPAVDSHVHALGETFAATVVVTDNFNVAKFSALTEAKRKARIQSVTTPNWAMESGASNYALGGTQRRQLFGQAAMVQAVKTKEMLLRPTVGHPLVMHLPSESVIPVFITPNKHLGYFILLDMEGNPITMANRRDIYNDLATSTNGTPAGTNGASQMIQMAGNLSMGVNTQAPTDPAQMVRIYGQLLEHDLKTRLASGAYGEGGKIQATPDIYQVMMARSLKKMQTQILYVPAELMSYVAFDYAENGTGRSLTEKSKIIGSMRAMLGFANVMAGIKNSVSRQKVTLTLSDNDIDASKTIARTMDEFTRRRNVTMPFVAADPGDMISYINMAGVEWNIEGKGAPAHKVDIEDKVSNRAKVDTELDTMLRDRHYQSFGLTPETVLASTGADFAATVVTNNQMYAKRVIQIQDVFTPHLEDIVKKITRNSAILLNALREVVVHSLTEIEKEGAADTAADVVDQRAAPATQLENYAPPKEITPERQAAIDRIVFEFIDAVRVELPRPDTATLASQVEAFDKMAEALDKGLSVELDQAFLTDANLGVFAERVEEVKAAFKAHYMRQWMRNNGFLPELAEITAQDEEGKPELDLLEATTSHANAISMTLKAYLERVGSTKETVKKDADALATQFPDANLNGGGGDMGGGDMGGDGGDFGGDTGGDDGLGGGDDLGGGGNADADAATSDALGDAGDGLAPEATEGSPDNAEGDESGSEEASGDTADATDAEAKPEDEEEEETGEEEEDKDKK